MIGIPFLSKPIDIYKQSYIEALEEFQAEGRHLKYDISEVYKDFQCFISALIALETHPNTSIGKVKESTYWLIDHDEFIGRISIRHTLNDYLKKYDGHIGYEIRPSKRKMGYGKMLLNLGLQQAKALGLKQVLIMCEASNIASIKIIEQNQAIFIEAYKLKIEGKDTYVRKYSIDLEPF